MRIIQRLKQFIATAGLGLFFAASEAWSQPLLFVGQADAEFAGAASYEHWRNPLKRPVDFGLANFNVNIPFGITAPLGQVLVNASDSALVLPGFLGKVQQRINGSIDVSVPLFGGAAFFSIQENASLAVEASIGDAQLHLDTALSDAGTVRMEGGLRLPLLFQMDWRSFTFGYTLQPKPGIRLAFQVHKHTITSRAAGELKPDIAGRILVASGESSTEIPIDYTHDKLAGELHGFYQGSVWSPEIGIQMGPFSLQSRMGAHLVAKGELEANYAVPFFIDPTTLETRFSEPDSFLAPDNLRKMLSSEVVEKHYRIHDRIAFEMPQSHTFSVDFAGGIYVLSYTKIYGNLGTYVIPDTSVQDSVTLNTRGFIDAQLTPDNILLFNTDLGWLRIQLGAFTLNADYRNSKNLLSGLSPVEIFGDPISPVLNTGFTWGKAVAFNLDLMILPLPAVRTGLRYGF